MQAPNQILKQIREAQGLSQQDLADYITKAGCQTSRNIIAKYESAGGVLTDQRFLLACKCLKIYDVLGTFTGDSVYTRLTDEGIRALQQAQALIENHQPYLRQKTVDLRLAPSSVAAGPGIMGDIREERWVSVPLEDIPPVANWEQLMVAEVSGRSMEPEMYDGDFVLFDPCAEVRPGRIIICYYDYGMMIKLYRSNGTSAWLESLNEEYESIPVLEGMAFLFQGEYLGKTTVIR